MRLPSLSRLAASAAATLRRFPVVLSMAAVATAAGLVLVQGDADEDLWVRILAVATLGLPLTFAVRMAAERRGWIVARRFTAFGLALLALGAVYLTWPAWTDGVAARRYAQLSAGFHLLAAFVPFAGVDEPRGFWQYNRALFLRFLTAALYVAVLQAGLSLAIGALDQLFGVPVPDRSYLRLWVVLAFLVQTWLFLGGVPDDLRALERKSDYPRGLELFTQYVLVPLVVVYLVILTAYAGRVLITWDWPGGWIGWLVSAVAVVGILAFLLVHPVREEADHRWVRIYGRWFWIALLPSVVLLALAVWQRIAQYGVTEDRYFLAAGTVWLGAVALYFAVSRSDDLERIPQSLCAVVLLTFVGPWSAYRVSEGSQLGRLEGLLAANDMVADGRARPATRDVPFEDRREISAAVRYLVERHGEASLAPLLGESLLEGEGSGTREERIVAALGVEYVHRGERTARPRHLGFHSRGDVAARRVAGYEHLVRGVSSDLSDTLALGDGLRVVADTSAVRLLRDGGAPLELSVRALAERLRAEGHGPRHPVPADAMWIEGRADGLAAALWLESIRARTGDGEGREELRVLSWHGHLLVGRQAAATE